MSNYPTTYGEFAKWFQDDASCYAYLFQIRWPEGFICPRCAERKYWLGRSDLYRCHKCLFKSSITAGTIFQDRKKPLLQWFHAAWHITENKHGISACGLQKALGLGSYHTAWSWLHKFRIAMVRPHRDKLCGEMEVDEIYIGGEKPGKRGRGAEGKELVLIVAEKNGKHIGRIRLIHIKDAKMSTLSMALKSVAEAGATFYTDGWAGYSTRHLKALGYNHVVVRTNAHLGDNLLPHANIISSLLKRWLLGTLQGGIQATHLSYYLDEFTFRFNRRTSKARGMLFYRLLENAIAISPTIEASLKGGKPPMAA
jgi:transposase-like protein